MGASLLEAPFGDMVRGSILESVTVAAYSLLWQYRNRAVTLRLSSIKHKRETSTIVERVNSKVSARTSDAPLSS